jgi:hypothetical protein
MLEISQTCFLIVYLLRPVGTGKGGGGVQHLSLPGGSVQLLNVQSIATKNYLGPPPGIYEIRWSKYASLGHSNVFICFASFNLPASK